MKKMLFLFLLIFGFTLVQAQLLWKITGKGLKQPSYLFGTHHLIPIQFLDSVPGLYKAFNECNTVVGEMALNNLDVTSKIQDAAIMPNRTNIKQLIKDTANYNKVDRELKKVLKFGLKDVSVMNPSLILSLYEIAIFKKATGYADDKQSDSYFQLVAAEKGKKVIGLESVEKQITILFGNGSLQRQAEVLVETVRQKDSVLNEIKHVNTLYRTGKIDELVKLSSHRGNIIDMTDEEYARLIDDRNAEWVEKLQKLMHNSSCFIAVGAMHLGGKNGLVKLLEREGYSVRAEK
jgi:hypothetical protein